MERADLLKMTAELSTLVGSIFIFYKSHQALARDTRLQEFFKTAYTFTPKVLIDTLEENYKAIIDKNLLNFTEDELSAQFLGFVKGEVISKSPVKSLLTQTKDLIVRKIVAEPLFSNTKNSDPKDHIIKTKQAAEFSLHDLVYANNMLIKNTDRMNSDFGLSKIGTSTEMNDSPVWVYTLAKLVFAFQLLISLLRIHVNIKGWRLGTKVTEYGIKLNNSMISFGQIVYDKKNKLLVMEKPYFILKDKLQLVSMYKDKIIRWNRIRWFSAALMIISCIMTVRRVYKLATKIRNRMREFLEQVRMNKLKGLSLLLTDSFKCVICIENPKNIIFVPCYHMALCSTCYDKLEKKSCPVCRKRINDTVKIFIV